MGEGAGRGEGKGEELMKEGGKGSESPVLGLETGVKLPTGLRSLKQ